jgi:hypothetical protein
MKLSSLLSLSALVLISAVGVQSGAADTSGGTSRTIPRTRKPANDAETKPSLGVFAGLADTAQGERNSTVGYGVDVAFQPLIPWSAGIELSRYTAGSDNDRDLNRNKLLFHGAFNFGGTTPVIKDSYAGLMLGPVFDEVGGRWDTEFGVAPTLGFDIPIAMDEAQQTKYTLGANANYLFVTGSNPDAFALNGMLKYWF